MEICKIRAKRGWEENKYVSNLLLKLVSELEAIIFSFTIQKPCDQFTFLKVQNKKVQI